MKKSTPTVSLALFRSDRDELADRLWSKVEKTDGCWNWLGYKDRQGYGRIKRPGSRTNLKVHRVAYALATNTDPEGLMILHSCDNPSCCNPKRLELGDNSKNMQQMYDRGRR